MIEGIALHREELRDLCRRYHVLRQDLIGSAARDDFDPQRSDVDFLVEFDRAHPEAMKFQGGRAGDIWDLVTENL